MTQVKIYDWETPFNDVPVSTINAEFERMWGRDEKIALVYRDGVFTGMAEPLKTDIENAAKYYEDLMGDDYPPPELIEHIKPYLRNGRSITFSQAKGSPNEYVMSYDN